MPSISSTNAFNAADEAKFEKVKLIFTEQVKLNFFKDETRQIIKEELKEIEELPSTVTLLQKKFREKKVTTRKIK